MKIFIFVFFAVALIILERQWVSIAVRKLSYSCKCSASLVEPGEPLHFESEARNGSRLPIMFVRVTTFLPKDAVMTDDTGRAQQDSGLKRDRVEMRFSLMGRSKVKRNIEFTFTKRGVYRVGEYDMAVGDLLGLSDTTFQANSDTSVVVMPKRIDNPAVKDVLGGFIGDISVRRFIMEDPIITRGFRDYTGREPMKDISWKRTAAAGKLMVKEYDHTSEINVIILLDLEAEDEEEIEQCYRLTRAACEALEAKKISYGLRTNGGLFSPIGHMAYMPQGLGDKHFKTIMYALGNARRVAYVSFQTLVEQAIKKQRNNENHIVIVPHRDEYIDGCIRRLESGTGNKALVLSGGEEL